MSVRRAQEEIDAAEFVEWCAYYALEPWGQERADLRAGIIASVVANVAPGRAKKAFTPQDFMPRYDAPVRGKQMSSSDIQAVFRVHTLLAGGTLNGQKG